MKIIDAYPPNFDKIKAAFPVRGTTVYTYGDTIFAPGIKFALSTDLLEHERVHTAQQGNNPEAWWDRYIADAEFRLSQEVAAYRRQYQFYSSQTRDRNKKFAFLRFIGSDLASPMYGSMVGMFEAMRLIQN